MSPFKVSYYDPFGLWPYVHNEIEAYLPLQSLRIRLPQRPIHIVSNIEIEFVPYFEKYTPRTPSTLLQEPLLSILLVGCDNVDTYRQAVRPQINEWQKHVLSRKDKEWLIIYVTNAGELLRFGGLAPGATALSRSMSQNSTMLLKKGIPVSTKLSHKHGISATGILNQFKNNPSDNMLEKLRSDFKDTRRERVLPVRLLQDSPSASEKWRGLMETIKEIIQTTFNTNYSLFEEEIRKLDSQRLFPGWNFCTFFVIKESIAQAFEAMHLYQESLKIYDELEAVFYQSPDELMQSWFPKVGGDEPSDMTSNLLDFTSKPYRDLIATNTISLFEFQLYLFSRQAHILIGKMDSLVEFSNRALKFLMYFSSEFLKMKGDSVQIDIFIAAWCYSACSDIFQAIEDALENIREETSGKKDKPISRALSTSRSSILLMAKMQLDRLGLVCGRLPVVPPFIYSFTKPNLAKLNSLKNDSFDALDFITSPTLQNLFSTDDSFDSAYLALSQKLIAEYETGSRIRSTAAVHASMAALHCARERFSYTINILTKTAYEYIDEGWLEVSKELLESLVQAYEQSQQWHALVRLCLRALSVPMLPRLQYSFFVASLLSGLKNLEEEITRPAGPYFEFRSINRIENSIEMALQLSIDNKLLTDVPVNIIKLQLKSTDNVWITYNSEKSQTLKPGLNTITLYSECPTVGDYNVDCLVVHIGSLVLSQEFDDNPPKLQLMNYPHLISITPEFFTDRLVLKISASGNHIEQGKITFENLEPLGALKTSDYFVGYIQSDIDHESYCPHKVSHHQDQSKLEVTIPKILPDQTLNVTISCKPIHNLNSQIFLPCSVQYQSSEASPIQYRVNLKGFIGRRPLDVYPSWIPKFSKGKHSFYLQLKLHGTAGHIPTRIFSVKLQPSEPTDVGQETKDTCSGSLQTYSWKESLTKFPHVPVLFPGQSLDYLFDYHDSLQGLDLTHPSQLRIQYRSIKEEVEFVLERMFQDFVKNELPTRHIQAIVQHIVDLLIESGAIIHFSMTDSLDLRSLEEKFFDRISFFPVIGKFCRVYPEITTLDFHKVLHANNHHQQKSLFLPCHLQYPKEVIYVKLNFPEESEIFKLGESYPLEYVFTLLDSDAEGSLSRQELTLHINSETLTDSGFWAISGKTKVNLLLEPKIPIKVQVVCTPTRAGFIRLPQVQLYSKTSTRRPSFSQTGLYPTSPEDRVQLVFPQQSQQIRVVPPTKSNPIMLNISSPESVPLPASPPHPSPLAPHLFSPVLPSSPSAFVRAHQTSYSVPHSATASTFSPRLHATSPPPFKTIPLHHHHPSPPPSP